MTKAGPEQGNRTSGAETPLSIRGLVKSYETLRAVDGLDLEVRGGEILGLVGPNGAGKTTTLRCVAGIVPSTEGRVRIAGHDLQEEPVAARSHLAYVPDEPRLFDNLTVWDHLLLFGRIYRVPEAREEGRRLLAEFGLHDRRDSFPSELSRGMKQKLLLALALIHRPSVLILDEPLTGLDPGAMRRTKNIIRATAEEGAAVIVSSHMLHLVEEICQRVALIHRGRKLLDGTLEQIRRAVGDLEEDADLEEIFLRATEESPAP